MNRLTRDQAAIIGAFTGICAGPFADIQDYAERVLGRSVWTHELGTKEVWEELKEASREDFFSICASYRDV